MQRDRIVDGLQQLNADTMMLQDARREEDAVFDGVKAGGKRLNSPALRASWPSPHRTPETPFLLMLLPSILLPPT